jgi:hypothetical protein
VIHRFGDSFAFARAQWVADGRGLARLVRKQRWRAAWITLLPLASSVRGSALALRRGQPKWLPYYAAFAAYNYAAMLRGLVARERADEAPV